MKTKTIISVFLLLLCNLSFAQKKSDELRAWQTFEEDGKFGYRYSDYGNIVVTIPAKFEHRYMSSFEKDSKYTEITKSSDPKKEAPCRTEAYNKYGIISMAIIDRKGNEVITATDDNTGYHVLQPTIFALEISYMKPPDITGCKMNIINIETKEVIAELPLNSNGTEVKIQPKYLMRADRFDFDNALYHSTQLTENVNDKLSKLHAAEKFDYLLVFPDDFDDANTRDKKKGFTGYLLWKDGKYKTIREEWLKEFK